MRCYLFPCLLTTQRRYGAETDSSGQQLTEASQGLKWKQLRTEGQKFVDKRKTPIAVPALLAVAYRQDIGVSLKQYHQSTSVRTTKPSG